MEILQNETNLLILRLRPVLPWFFGCMWAILGLYLLAFPQLFMLSCNRSKSISCKLMESGLLVSHSKEIPLNELKGSEVDNDGVFHNVIINTSDDSIPFGGYSIYESEQQAIVSDINNFINNPQTQLLAVQQDDRFRSYLLGSIFVIIGFFILNIAPVVTLILNKNLNILTLKRQGLLPTKDVQYRLSEIQDIKVEDTTDDETCYRVSIVLISGRCLPLTFYYSNNQTSIQEVASCITNFLNI